MAIAELYTRVCAEGLPYGTTLPGRRNKKKNRALQPSECIENWQTAKQISIHEALRAISMLGGQGFFFWNCKGNCKKNGCKCRKNGRQCNSKCHPCSTACENHN